MDTQHATHRDGWTRYMKRKDLQPTTIRLYSRTVDGLEMWAESEGKEVDSLKRSDIEAYLDLKGGSASAVSNRISAFRSYFRYLVRAEVRETDATLNIDAPRQRRGVPKPVEDLAGVLDALDVEDVRANEKGKIPRRVGETRDMATFLVETGLRSVVPRVLLTHLSSLSSLAAEAE